ncbi:hypothetical protein [Halocynthiibacter namhaensis]|uniref:hypothetical protein n=1 Tax=Halocynthiibacter namhaensis TaxID=1290553 RepID=UPI001EE1B90D|nr:hypothetical protein [Halocynthiibacter namhaensis]
MIPPEAAPVAPWDVKIEPPVITTDASPVEPVLLTRLFTAVVAWPRVSIFVSVKMIVAFPPSPALITAIPALFPFGFNRILLLFAVIIPSASDAARTVTNEPKDPKPKFVDAAVSILAPSKFIAAVPAPASCPTTIPRANPVILSILVALTVKLFVPSRKTPAKGVPVVGVIVVMGLVKFRVKPSDPV